MGTRKYIALLMLLVVIFFARQLFFGEVFYCCDNLAINIPSKVFLIEELKRGTFPLFNPYILSGSPFLADINLGLLYPLNALYFILSPFRALTIGVVIDFLIAIIGMYVFSRSVKLSDFSSTMAAVIFTFSGTMVTYINNVPMLQVASLLPWVMWAWTKKSYLILVLFLTLQIFAGHPQLTYYTWLVGIGYVLLVSPCPLKEKVKYLISVGGLVFLLSSIQLVPFFEFVRASTRVGRGFAYASFDSLHPSNILRLINPNIVGSLSTGTDWLQGGSVYGYIGVLPLLLVLAVPLKKVQVRFFLFAAILSFVLALGKYTPVFFIAYKLIPGLGSFRSPQHFLLLYTFSIAMLSGFCIDEIFQKQKKIFFYSQFVVGILLLVTGFWFIDLGKYPLMMLSKFRLLTGSAQGEIILLATGGFIGTGLFLLIAHYFQKRLVLFFIVFLSLFFFSSHGLVSVRPQAVDQWQRSGEEMAKRMDNVSGDADRYRIFISPRLYANPVKKQFGVKYQEIETAWQIAILRTNINMPYHLSTIDGYAALIDKSYKELFQKGEGDPTGIEFDLATIDWNRLGVRYVLASPKEQEFTNNQFIPVWSDKNRILYRNLNALPVNRVSYHPKSVIIGFWLTVVGIVIFMYVRGRRS